MMATRGKTVAAAESTPDTEAASEAHGGGTELRFDIGRRLRWALTMRFGTMWSIAVKLGMQERTVRRWFTAETMPALDTAHQLARYGINIHWAVTGSGCAWTSPDVAREVNVCCDACTECPHGIRRQQTHEA
jgi:hypothetical protein